MKQRWTKQATQILRDALGLAGAALLIWGVRMIYLPAAFILAGVLLFAGAVLLARAEDTPTSGEPPKLIN